MASDAALRRQNEKRDKGSLLKAGTHNPSSS